MSEHENIIAALSGIAKRLWLKRSFNEFVRAACLMLVGTLVYQILLALLPAPPATLLKALLLAWILGVAVWALLRVRGKLALEQAATVADQSADLKDELTSAYWFMGREQQAAQQRAQQASPFIPILLQRASNSARRLSAPQVIPSVAPKGVAVFALLAVATAALAWWSPRLQHSMLGRTIAQGLGAVQDAASFGTDAKALTRAREEAARQAKEVAAAEAAEKARAQAHARALAQAQDTAAALAKGGSGAQEQEWAKLERALDKLKAQGADEELIAAIKARDAKRAAKLLEELARKQELAQADPAVQAQLDVPFTDRGEGFIPKLQDLFRQGDDPFDDPKSLLEDENAKLRKAANKVQKPEETIRANERNRNLRHEEAYSASIGRDSVIEASRYGERDPEKKEGTGSEESGATAMKGGVMHRRAAMTRGDPNEDGGSRVGDAEGESKADPMLGKQTTRLKAQLKRVDIEAKKSDDQSEGDPDKFFAATRQQEAKLAYTEVARSARYVSEEVTSGEHVPLAYRSVVKDYFINLRQKEK